VIRRKRSKSLWSPTVAGTGWGESTFAELSWDKSRSAALRWASVGAVVGLVIALVAFAPAAWLARAVTSASNQRLLLADARGTVWSGSAVLVLTGGPDSRDASALPGRLSWTLGLKGLGLELVARHACCLNGPVALQVKPGFGRMSVSLAPSPGWTGQWPSAWLGGLGTPWNTLQLGGPLPLASSGLRLQSVAGQMRLTGDLQLQLRGASSRLSALPTLGSYQLLVQGSGRGDEATQLRLSSLEGPLRLSGEGQWTGARLRFRGTAQATDGQDGALANLLNIIGRRQGALSVISIG
jgi:general secretion pathway protein N